MGVRSPKQFLKGLRDGRDVYYQGKRVECVTDHPELGVAARHAAIDFQLADDPAHRDLAVVEEGQEIYSAYYRVPRDSSDLFSRARLIELATVRGATLVILIKEIGTDALFALKRVLARAGDSKGLERLNAYYRDCRDRDLALAGAQTDAKAYRSKRPGEQSDPAAY